MRRWFHREPRYASRQDVEHLKFLLDRLGEIVQNETGMQLASAASVQVRPGVPPGLVAASRCRHTAGEPVSLDIGGVPMIAVVSGEGDPREWYATVAGIASLPHAARPGIPRIGHRAMPEGLLAVAVRGPGTAFWVAGNLPAGEQRAAMLIALRAARRQGWRTPVLIPAAAFAAGLAWHAARAHAGTAAQTVKAHALGTAVTGAAVAAVGVGAALFTLAPLQAPHPATSAPHSGTQAPHRGAAGVRRVPRARHLAPGRVSRDRHSGHGLAEAGRGIHPPSSPGQPSPAPSSGPSSVPSPHSSPPGTPTPSPRPSPRTSSPVPVPSPTVKVCLKWEIVLGVKVCVKFG